MDKKGSIIYDHLGEIILTLLGVVLIISVYYLFFSQSDINRETCYDSVLAKGTLPDILGTKDVASLRCTTRKICLTDKTFGNGDCKEEFGSDKYETVRLGSDAAKRENEVNKFFARELADCWSMMHKGELQIFTRESSKTQSCVVCLRIGFDKELKMELDSKVKGIGDYILMHEVPNQNMSYWKYLTGTSESEFFSKLNERGTGAEMLKNNYFSTEQKAIVFIEVGSSTFWESILGKIGATGMGVVGLKAGSFIGSFLIPVPVVGTVVGGTAGLATGVILGWVVGENTGGYFTGKKFGSSQMLVDYNPSDPKELKDLQCTSFENIP